MACRVEYLLGKVDFICPANRDELCIGLSPITQPGLLITNDKDLNAAYIIPVPHTSDYQGHVRLVLQFQEKACDAMPRIHQSCQWYNGVSHLCNPGPSTMGISTWGV